MSGWQWAAVLVLAALNALDGFDVLSISFASPGIAHDWGIDQGTLGWVLSTELLGMAVGSVLLGNVADKKGSPPDDSRLPGRPWPSGCTGLHGLPMSEYSC